MLEGELEPGSAGKMWCYCCELEIEKHVTNGQVSIEWAGLLEHMTGSVARVRFFFTCFFT